MCNITILMSWTPLLPCHSDRAPWRLFWAWAGACPVSPTRCQHPWPGAWAGACSGNDTNELWSAAKWTRAASEIKCEFDSLARNEMKGVAISVCEIQIWVDINFLGSLWLRTTWSPIIKTFAPVSTDKLWNWHPAPCSCPSCTTCPAGGRHCPWRPGPPSTSVARPCQSLRGWGGNHI